VCFMYVVCGVCVGVLLGARARVCLCAGVLVRERGGGLCEDEEDGGEGLRKTA
jgi:hypothetical protein